MKYNSIATSNLAFKLTLKAATILASAFISLCLLINNNALAANSTIKLDEQEGRWFEIEVILFKQVSNNSENTEQFTSRDLSYKKQRAFDLLAPYLQPDIASLKKLLPNCESPEKQFPYDITVIPHIIWPEKKQPDEVNVVGDRVEDSNTDHTNTSIDKKDVKRIESLPRMSVKVISPELDESSLGDLITSEAVIEKTYQVQYADIELPVYNQYPIDSNSPLCVIPTASIVQHLTAEQLVDFNVDAFPVEKISTTINGLEQWQDDDEGEITWASDKPYLISQGSLRLKSIANRIKRSRNYVPLLHLGWRQLGEERRQAKAMRVYAGKSLDLEYQQALAKQSNSLQSLELQVILDHREESQKRQEAEALMRNPINLTESEVGQTEGLVVKREITEDDDETHEGSITEQVRLQAKQQQLNNIFSQFELLDIESNVPEKNIGNNITADKDEDSDNSNIEIIRNEEQIKQVISELSYDITAPKIPLGMANDSDLAAVITAPLQSWFLDGLFKVHLEHYLYINSEFNILDLANKSSVKNTPQVSLNKNNNTDQNKIVSFKQNRRVITGEIHYFDHPKIGMVVQIRRFDPTKPAAEAVSQSKK